MLLTNLQAATMTGGYGIVAKAAVRIENGRIAWVGPATKAPSEMKAGFSMRSAEMRPRISSGAAICSIAMLLEACAISAAPPITLNTIATASVGLSATPMMDAPLAPPEKDAPDPAAMPATCVP